MAFIWDVTKSSAWIPGKLVCKEEWNEGLHSPPKHQGALLLGPPCWDTPFCQLLWRLDWGCEPAHQSPRDRWSANRHYGSVSRRTNKERITVKHKSVSDGANPEWTMLDCTVKCELLHCSKSKGLPTLSRSPSHLPLVPGADESQRGDVVCPTCPSLHHWFVVDTAPTAFIRWLCLRSFLSAAACC